MIRIFICSLCRNCRRFRPRSRPDAVRRFRLPLFLILFAAVPALAVLPVNGEGIPDDPLGEVARALPEAARALLPEGLTEELEKGDGADGGAIASLLSPDGVRAMLGRAAAETVGPLTRSFASLAAVLLLSAAARFSAGGAADPRGTLSPALSSFLTLAAALPLYRTVGGAWEGAEEAIGSMTVFLRTVLPVCTALRVSSGGITAAAVGEGAFLAVLALIGEVCALVGPILKGMLAVVLIGAFGDGTGADLLEPVRKSVTGLLLFSAGLIGFFFAGQTAIAAGTDGVLDRTVRFAVGRYVPVVGPAAGEAAAAALAGVRYLRTAVGTLASAAIVLLCLTPGLTLLLTRFALSLADSLAALLGCVRERQLIGGIRGVVDLAAAVLFTVTVLTVLSVALLTASLPAGGGSV